MDGDRIQIKLQKKIEIDENKLHKDKPMKLIITKSKDAKRPNLKSNTNDMSNSVKTHYDKYNLIHIRYLLALSDDEWKSNFTKKYTAKETKQWLKQYRCLLTKILEDGNEEVKREYTVRRNNRLYADGGIQTLERNLRNFIQADSVKDYDMVGAQPTILLYLTKKAGLESRCLQYFIDNREKIFEAIGREKGKDAVIYSLFCDKPKRCGNTDIDSMIQEYINNRDILIHKYKQNINADREDKDKNPKGSKMSSILCYWENLILNKVIDKYNDLVGTLLFDGFYSTVDISIAELNALTSEYGIKWKVKPLETVYELPEDFDIKSVQTYKEQVKQFEEEVCLITFAENYKVRDDIDGSWKTMTDKGIRIKYKNWRTINSDGEEIDFIDRWLRDKNRKDYNRMTFHPYSLSEYNSTHAKEFNTFKGFKAKNLGRKIDDNEVEQFTDHLRTCFGWEADTSDAIVKFLVTHMAHIIQKPHKKIEGIIVLRGYEGTGKDTFKQIFNRLIGKEYVYECEGMRDIITKDAWNDHLVDKLVVVMNEATSEDGIKNIEGLKHKCTTSDLNVKEKFMKNLTMKDLNNMIINSNNNCCVIISPTDRRYVLLLTNEELAKLKEYWDAFYAYLDDEEKMDILYTWLLQQEVEDYNFEKDRVITNAYKKLATKNISEPYLVLYYYLTKHIKDHGNSTWRMKSSEFNKKCFKLSQDILDRKHTIKKGVIKDNMEKIPIKYIEQINVKDESKSSCVHWVVKDPERLLKRLNKLEFQYFDPNQIHLEDLDREVEFMSDDDDL